MMPAVLLGIFIILFVLEYRIQKSFVAPVSLLLASFLLALTLMSVNAKNWEIHINLTFVLCIFLAVASFSLGAFIIEFMLGRNKALVIGQGEREPFDLNEVHYPAALFLIISVICMAVYFGLMLKRLGFAGSIGTILRRIYMEVTSGSSSSFVMHQMIEIVVAIAKINLFKLFLMSRNRHAKENVLPTVLIFLQFLMFAGCAVISTDRNIILRFFIYLLALWILFETGKKGIDIDKTNLKLFGKVFLVIVAVALLFFALGKMRKATSGFGRMIGIYGGSGLYCFNQFVQTEVDYQYGDSTFLLLKNTLQSFGLFGGDSAESIIVDDFIAYKSSTGYVFDSNIYSAMRPYYEDFGIFGMIIFPMVLGLLFEFLYVLAKKYKGGFAWAFYALMIFPVAYFTIAEQFFRRFHLGIVYEIGWFAFFYCVVFVFGRQRLLVKRNSLKEIGNGA